MSLSDFMWVRFIASMFCAFVDSIFLPRTFSLASVDGDQFKSWYYLFIHILPFFNRDSIFFSPSNRFAFSSVTSSFLIILEFCLSQVMIALMSKKKKKLRAMETLCVYWRIFQLICKQRTQRNRHQHNRRHK